jgi:hypothetical protein
MLAKSLRRVAVRRVSINDVGGGRNDDKQENLNSTKLDDQKEVPSFSLDVKETEISAS